MALRALAGTSRSVSSVPTTLTTNPFVTQAMIDNWFLTADTCQTLNIPRGIYKHRLPEGTEATLGGSGSGRNKVYTAPADRQVRVTQDFACWVVWKELMLRGGSTTGGDTSAAEQWSQRALGQMPVIDIADDGVVTLLPVQDEDWVLSPDGKTLLRIENPVVSADGAYWTFSLVAQR